MTTIFVRGLTFHGFHGVSEEERRVGCPMRLDLDAVVFEEAGQTDDVADTVDYAAMGGAALEIATAGSRQTVEKVVGEIGAELLVRFPRIWQVTVRLAKLGAPLPFGAEGVGVERSFSVTAGE